MITGTGQRSRGQPGAVAHASGLLAREIRALFAEARRRRRRRRLAITVALAASAALGAAVVTGQFGGSGHRRGSVVQPAPHARAAPRWPEFSLPSAVVAWFDASGTIRVGNVATLTQRPVGHVVAPPCCQVVRAGQRLFWAGRHSRLDYIMDYDLATKARGTVAPGWAVFTSGDGRSVYIAQSRRRLLELPASGSGAMRRLSVPVGWRLVPLPWAAAGGITVSRGPARRAVIGLWWPRTGQVRVIGHGRALAAYTAPSGRRGLVAWQPDGCPLQHCPVEITDTSGHKTLTARSPGRYGFLGQGVDMAFSPSGTELATFVSINKLSSFNSALFVPALVNTSTGAVRLIRRAVMSNGELGGWLLWLPGGQRLLAGPAQNISRYAGYALDARTATARPFTFFPGSSAYAVNSSSDISYGAVLVSRRSH